MVIIFLGTIKAYKTCILFNCIILALFVNYYVKANIREYTVIYIGSSINIHKGVHSFYCFKNMQIVFGKGLNFNAKSITERNTERGTF